MKKRQNNVIIIGGGLIGLIAGYMLSKKKIPTAIFDSGQITDKKTINFDIRTTAIAEESKNFLEKSKKSVVTHTPRALWGATRNERSIHELHFRSPIWRFELRK